ncbi:uncharacterized protein M6B38_263400 [Iris pallida]|uniref:BED-type domain-containing protein n=1 Tax=Iris pallida TaxID=29817 RepID=A0AAX6IDU5_IRIPA|nr:uncharacterized protein M6B38_263400 [Iris pallida]
MPRNPDIGWEHGTMVGGHRHHVQCNYCQMTMIGGITRFKKHLASNRGEIKGCDSVPKDVQEMINKHLATLQTRKEEGRKKKRRTIFAVPLSVGHKMGSDASDGYTESAAHESPNFHDGEMHSSKLADKQVSAGTRALADIFSSGMARDEQALQPPKATDPGWSHGLMVNGDRQKIKCIYCDKVMSGGGISRLKQHLAGERGNIAPCEKVPDDVKAQIQQHIGFKVLEKLKKQKESENFRSVVKHDTKEECEDIVPYATSSRDISGKRRRKELDEERPHRRRPKKLLNPQVLPAARSTLYHAFASQESIDQADVAVAKFMFDAGIPFSAVNSCYFQRMADAIAAVGPGYKMPTYHSLRSKLLNNCANEVGEVCKEIRKSWEVTGCTVMVDRWMDKNGQVVINFFAYCPKGTMLLKSVDASDSEECSESLVGLFDCIVQEVGAANIVNFITDSTPCYKAAGQMLMDRYRTFFWSICASNSIESMLKGIGELDEVKETLSKAKRICQFIYNNAWVLNFMRKKTDGKDIFQPAMTEFVTKFLTLDSMVSLKDCLHQMFTSTQWEQSIFSKQSVGEEVKEIVLDSQFWLSCTKVMKISRPLVTVFHLVDSEDRPSIGYLYDALEKAKKAIILAFNSEEAEYMPFLEIVDRAREELHSPLHAAAYYLNPSIYYNPSFSITNVIQKGLLDCIETLEPNLTAQDNITRHKAFYEEALGDFSRPVASRGRESLSPATWWSLYASDYPELQRFAVKILSQACGISASEKDWNMPTCVHPKSKNKLENERLNNLTFVHHNLRLQQRQFAASGSKSLARGEHDPISLEGRSASCGEWIEDPGALEGEDVSWMNVALPSDVCEALGADDGGAATRDRSDDSMDS